MNKQPEICKSGPTYYIVKEDGEVHLPNTVNIDGKRIINVINKDFENTMTKKVGTLKEIGAKVGDVVGDCGLTIIVEERFIDSSTHDTYTIIKRAEDGPVRDVVTKEIVPGWYGHLKVSRKLDGVVLELQAYYGQTGVDELDTLISNLQAIREAM